MGGHEGRAAVGAATTTSTGSFVDITTGQTLALIAPYVGSSVDCQTTGFNAIDSCGDVVAGAVPSATLNPNQLGRLWKPCDSVVNPNPSPCQ